MVRFVSSLITLAVVGFVFGLFIASLVAPVAMASDDPTPTCCEWDYGGGDCDEYSLQNKPWVTPCFAGCHCMPNEWMPNAYCVCT